MPNPLCSDSKTTGVKVLWTQQDPFTLLLWASLCQEATSWRLLQVTEAWLFSKSMGKIGEKPQSFHFQSQDMGKLGNLNWPFTWVYSQGEPQGPMRNKSLSCLCRFENHGVRVMWMAKFPGRTEKELNQRIRESELVVWIFNQIWLLSPRQAVKKLSEILY